MQQRNATTENGIEDGARTCLSEASPAAQFSELRFLLHRSVQRALFLVAFSLAVQRKRTYSHPLPRGSKSLSAERKERKGYREKNIKNNKSKNARKMKFREGDGGNHPPLNYGF
jgi:hypothetical protein